MKSSEEAIEKVLAGLRDAEAPDGMERRILERLDERTSMQSRSRPIWLMMPARPLTVRSMTWGVALAGIFAIAVAVPAIRRLGHGSGASA